MKARHVESLRATIAAALPDGWAVRVAIMSRDTLEVYHPGDAGGGVLIRWGRRVIVIEPSLRRDGSSRGPVGRRDEMGEFSGHGWRDGVVASVLRGIRLFDALYSYARKDVKK